MVGASATKKPPGFNSQLKKNLYCTNLYSQFAHDAQNQSESVDRRKRHMTPFMLNIGQKLLRFRRVTLGNLKIGKLPVTLTT